MSEQPPSYDDVDVREAPIKDADPLLVRLEVWHYYTLGWSPILNHELARLFKALELANWTVRDVEAVESSGLTKRDHFVPVQVDFEHKLYTNNDDNGGAQYDARELFRHIAPAIIFQLFLRIGSKPYTMNLIALNVPKSRKNIYGHLFHINRLNATSRSFQRPTEVKDTEAVATLLSDLADGLLALSYIVDIFGLLLELKDPNRIQLTFINIDAAEQMFNRAAAIFDTYTPLATIIPNLRRSYEARVNQAEFGRTLLQKTWQQAVNPFLAYQKRFSRVVMNLQRIQAGEVVTPQVLYQAALDLHAGSLLFTKARECLEPHLETKLELYKQEMRNPKTTRNRSALVAVVGAGAGGWIGGASMAFWASNPLGWGIGAIIFGGILVGSYAQYFINTSSKKKETIEKFKRDLKDMAEVANEYLVN
ncbi:hypothetical protein ACQKWADRAFT_314995 [Trichoderma austrokoningii]